MSSQSPESSPPPPSSGGSPPPPASSSPPPPSSSSPPPPSSSSPPPPSSSSSPPPPDSDSSPPPPKSGKGKSPPPPPPKSKSTHQSPPSRSENDDQGSKFPQLNDGSGKHGDSSNETAIIAGVAAGVGLLLIVLIASVICCCCRKKKRKSYNHQPQYYNSNTNPPHQNMNNNYYNSSSSDYMVKIPPPPAPGSAAVSSEYGWTPAMPPPPPNMHSSEMSSAGFSGPYSSGAPHPNPHPHHAVSLGCNQSSFTYEDLAAATGGFVQANLLGQGGFGFVHKGVLPNGKEVAVKSLKTNSGQGEREFHAEVDIISRVHHRHLVSLVGYCTTGAQRLLVYEYVDNGTLEYHLHGTGRPSMDWPTRHQIALGAAKGFAYLHEDCHPKIIHRDIKTANILIDSNFEAKVADFGLAKLSSDNYTHVSTRIMGTFGYLAPEYASSGKLTEKSDVYSFGIMLLELITGRRPIDLNSEDDDSLVDWARPILLKVQEGGSYEELVDPKLGDNYDPNEMLHMVACAGACIRHSARGRPKMSQVVRALEGDISLEDLNNGPKASTQMSSNGSDLDLRRFAKGALSSQEFSSSEEHTMDFQSRR